MMTGAVEVYVDGAPKLRVNGYNSSGWNNPVTKLVFSEETAKDHRIEIKMATGAENIEFTILAFGYCD